MKYDEYFTGDMSVEEFLKKADIEVKELEKDLISKGMCQLSSNQIEMFLIGSLKKNIAAIIKEFEQAQLEKRDNG